MKTEGSADDQQNDSSNLNAPESLNHQSNPNEESDAGASFNEKGLPDPGLEATCALLRTKLDGVEASDTLGKITDAHYSNAFFRRSLFCKLLKD